MSVLGNSEPFCLDICIGGHRGTANIGAMRLKSDLHWELVGQFYRAWAHAASSHLPLFLCLCLGLRSQQCTDVPTGYAGVLCLRALSFGLGQPLQPRRPQSLRSHQEMQGTGTASSQKQGHKKKPKSTGRLSNPDLHVLLLCLCLGFSLSFIIS